MDRFSFETGTAPRCNTVSTGKVRITLLTPCLLRLETGVFTNRPTQTVWNRNLGEVSFHLKRRGPFWTFQTSEVGFCVNMEKGTMDHITLSDGTLVVDFQKGNLLGTARTLDMVNGSTRLDKGILSKNGVSVLDDTKSLLVEQSGRILPRKKCSDLYFFAYGQDYIRTLQDFFRLTGPVPLIPKYALGNWWSRYHAYTQEEYRGLMQQFIDRKIPITVATIDMDWHWTDVVERFGEEARPGLPRHPREILYNAKLHGWTGYSWNTELFPDHRELLQWLHDRGLHVTLNVHPSQGIRFYENAYRGVCQKLGLDPDRKKTVSFNIADPAFVRTYLDDVHHPLEEEGVDFWWLDWQQGNVTNIPGLDPLWALNHYHFLDSGRSKRPLILSRYAGLGSHRYPLGFSGDTFATWKSLDFQPYFTNNAANAGYTWWSHDIGGHMLGIQDDELYLRWLQYGVFSPINRLHSSNSDFMGKEPWKRCHAVAGIAEDFLRLRHKLIPYLYSANYETHSKGIPICQPLYFRWKDAQAYQVKNEYLFGGQMLVCPITEKSDPKINLSKTVLWLPEGRWTDFFTGRIYRGGDFVTMYRDLDSIPVLMPEGAIVPMYGQNTANDLSLDQPLEIHVWRGNGSYTLYEDDGESYAYREGKFTQTQFTVREIGERLIFTIHPARGDTSILPETRKIRILFRDLAQAKITLNGTVISGGSGCGAEISLNRDHPAMTFELSDCVPTVNRPKKELLSELLTRVQAPNNWKLRRFAQPSDRYPLNIRMAIEELEHLSY